MRATPRPDARPRRWRWLVLAVVTLVATALALGLALHHDDVAPTATSGIEQSIGQSAPSSDVVEALGVLSSPGAAGAVVCSLLILCCVAILRALMRARAGSLELGDPRPRSAESRPSDILQPAPLLVSLTALSISRT